MHQCFRFRPLPEELPAGSDRLPGSRYRAGIGEVKAFPAETASFPIFQRAAMPQDPSPDTGDGLQCGRFSVYWPTECVGAIRFLDAVLAEDRQTMSDRAGSVGQLPRRTIPIDEG